MVSAGEIIDCAMIVAAIIAETPVGRVARGCRGQGKGYRGHAVVIAVETLLRSTGDRLSHCGAWLSERCTPSTGRRQ
jgi:hypothetical protein